jgi:hypothetical protein
MAVPNSMTIIALSRRIPNMLMSPKWTKGTAWFSPVAVSDLQIQAALAAERSSAGETADQPLYRCDASMV